MKRVLRKIYYPKFTFLLITYLLAAIFFYEGTNYPPLHDLITRMGYASIFLSGIFYSYSITAGPATAALLVLAKQQNILLAGIIGGIGALLSDILIFLFVRYSFTDEIKRIRKEKIVTYLESKEKQILHQYQKYLLPVFAGILIALPLPTEIGTTLLAGMKKITLKKFIIIAYLLHTTGIIIILTIGNLI